MALCIGQNKKERRVTMKRKLLALFLTLSMALSLSAAALAAGSSDTFSDVGENSWYAGAVAYVSGKGYMNG